MTGAMESPCIRTASSAPGGTSAVTGISSSSSPNTGAAKPAAAERIM